MSADGVAGSAAVAVLLERNKSYDVKRMSFIKCKAIRDCIKLLFLLHNEIHRRTRITVGMP